MELLDDIKQIIVLFLNNGIITRINTYYRDLYFRINGICISDVVHLNSESKILKKYKIRIPKYAGYHIGISKITEDDDILNNIVNVHTGLPDQKMYDFVEKLENLKILKIYHVSYLALPHIKPDVELHLIVFPDHINENLLEIIRKNRTKLTICEYLDEGTELDSMIKKYLRYSQIFH